MNTVQIAHVLHEANRAMQDEAFEPVDVPWTEVDWPRLTALVEAIDAFDPTGTPATDHDAWMRRRAAEGWTYGPIKRTDLKQHPCMLPFDDLPPDQQAKDVLFRGIVSALRPQ